MAALQIRIIFLRRVDVGLVLLYPY